MTMTTPIMTRRMDRKTVTAMAIGRYSAGIFICSFESDV
jgi:hypothetical protein